jgi:hypothetical protein
LEEVNPREMRVELTFVNQAREVFLRSYIAFKVDKHDPDQIDQ